MIGELNEASGRTLTLGHNISGSANWDYPMSGDYASIIKPINTCISAERYNWRATLAMNLAGTPGEWWDWIWSGFVLPINEDWTTDRMKVGCVGWAERMNMRQLKRDKTWTAKDDSYIIEDTLAEMNLPAFPDVSAYPVLTVAGSNPATPTWMAWGGTLPNEGPGGATAYRARSPITITKTRNQFVLPIWTELSGIEDSCDWWVHPKTRLLYTYRRRCALRDVVVAFRWGPNNLAQFTRDIAADQKTNYALVTGAANRAAFMDNPDDQAINGLIESHTAWSDCTSIDVLMAEAGMQIIYRENGRITYGVTPFHYGGGIGLPPTSVPEPFVDYDPVGDEFKLTARHPKRGNIMLQTVRSFGCTVNINEQNDEELGQLQVAP